MFHASNKKLALVSIATTCLIWGISFPIIKLILVEVPPFSLAFIRFTFASLLLVPFFIFDDIHHPIKFKDMPRMIIIAILGPTVTNTLIYLGIGNSSPTNAAVIHSLFPVFMALASIIFLGEQIKKNVIIGIIIATLGGFVIIGQPLLALNLSDSIQGAIGNFLILASVVSWTAYTIGSKELFSRYSYITITAFSFVVGMVALAPFSLYEYFKQPDWILNISRNTIIAIVFMVIFSSIIAYLLYEWSIKLLSANLIGVVSHTQIIWAIIGSYIFLKELISIYFIFGALFILFGVYQTTQSLPNYHIHRGHKI